MQYFVDYVCHVAKFIISVKTDGNQCISAIRWRRYFVSTRMPMFMSASVYCIRIPVCACAVVASECGAPHGLFKPSGAEGPLPDGYFPGSAKL